MLRKLKNRYHLTQAAFAKVRHRTPYKDLIFIGITGTDGKTTTATLLHKILSDAKIQSALISTIGIYIGDTFYESGFHTTTPSSFELQKYIKFAEKKGVTHVIIEVTSHALDQNRTWGIPFKIGIITNVSNEHLDYHKTYDKYLRTKAKLLQKSKKVILNKDDKSYAELKKLIKNSELYEYSLEDTNAYVTRKDLPSEMKLMGEFNKHNALAAMAAAKLLKVPIESIKKSVSEFTAPNGRQEVVYDKEFQVIVDFAHTPAAFEKLLSEVKKITRGRLIHVFGAAGGRDAMKRPYMGNASSKYADVIILTSEDPRHEAIEKINTHIMAGFEKDIELYDIQDRKKAIENALSLAKKGDTVLVTGKGHEKSMNIRGKEIPWDEKNVIIAAIQNIK